MPVGAGPPPTPLARGVPAELPLTERAAAAKYWFHVGAVLPAVGAGADTSRMALNSGSAASGLSLAGKSRTVMKRSTPRTHARACASLPVGVMPRFLPNW